MASFVVTVTQLKPGSVFSFYDPFEEAPYMTVIDVVEYRDLYQVRCKLNTVEWGSLDVPSAASIVLIL